MANPKPWLKMWAEWPNDPKMVKLNLAEIGAWWELVTLAHNCNNAGRITTGNGRALTIKEILKTCRVNTPVDSRSFRYMIDKMTEDESLHWESDTLVVTNYVSRQEQVPSESKEAVRERVRKWRKIQKEKGALPLDNPPPLEREGEGEGDVEGNGVTPVTSKETSGSDSGVSVTGNTLPQGLDKFPRALDKGLMSDYKDTNMLLLSRLYEENIGPLKPALREEFNDFIDDFRGPETWIQLAFKVALSYNKRSWRYIRTILEDWEEKGGPDDDKSRQPGAKRKQPDESRRRPLDGARESGWEIVGDSMGHRDEG